MTGRGRIHRLLIACLLLAVLAPASAQDGATYTVQDIEYYFATGARGSGQLTLGNEGTPETFDGCGWAKLRPDNNRGRIRAFGTHGGQALVVDVGSFTGPNATPDSMGPDLALGDLPPDASVSMAAIGKATVRLGGEPLVDPVTGNTSMQGTWSVQETPDGHEMHMRVASDPELSPQGPFTWEASSGPTYMPPDDEHQNVLAVPNERWTGTAVLTMEATTLAPAGQNELRVEVYAPNGTAVAAFDMAPAAMEDAVHEVAFGLDLIGDHHVVITGQVSLLSYTVTVEQTPPGSFGIDLSWDDVVPGYAGLEERESCEAALSAAVMSGRIPPRADPVPFDWTTSLFTIGAGVTLLLVATAIVMAGRAQAAAKQAVQD